nr:phosphatidate cytidylyltransferase [bacterium]
MARYITAALLLAFVALMLTVGIPLIGAMIALFAFGMAWEMSAALEKINGAKPYRLLAAAFVPVLYAAYWLGGILGMGVAGLAMLMAALAIRVFRPDVPAGVVEGTVSCMVYPGIPMAGMLLLGVLPATRAVTRSLLIFGIGVSALSDAFAMFGGMWFGKRKLCPKVSPNKTVAGLVACLIGGPVGGLLVWMIAQWVCGANFPVVHFMLMGLIVAMVTALGDLIASSFKRAAGIKDFGNIFPGHGGVLDRLDGISFSCCAVLFYALIAGWMGL